MNSVLLSICISSYNRGDKCSQLVKRILTIQDERYNVFICDDHSDKETIMKLKPLINNKVKLIRNESNLGPCPNWFETVNCGDGIYLLHVLDRDDIDISYLQLILDILEKNSVGAGYFGRSAISPVEGIKKQINFAICKKGKEAFSMMGVPIHPTGFLIEKKTWEQGNFKKFFYESDKYGIYPHAYVLGIVALKKNILFSPIPFYRYMYRQNNKRSRFYEKNRNDVYWWLPDSVMKTDNRLILYLCHFAEDSYKEDFICRRFQHGLYRATILYKRIAADQFEMDRYGILMKNISLWEMIINSFKYRICFTYILNKLQMKGFQIRSRINKIWYENLRMIIKEG